MAFAQHMLKWDNVDYFLPMRHFFHDALNDNHLPAWNSHINLGFPNYADPQSGAWYPVLWVFQVLPMYGFKALNLEWLFHVLMAGVGMFQLTKHLKASVPVATFAALAYSLSGFIVGTAQILPFIIGACWLPWCLVFFLKTLQDPNWKNSTWLAVILYLQVTGAYPAFTIIVFYLFVALFVYKLFTRSTRRKGVLALVLGVD